MLLCPAARHAAQWHAHGVMWRGVLPAAPLCGALPAPFVTRRQPLHFGAFPLAGQSNFELHTETRGAALCRAALAIAAVSHRRSSLGSFGEGLLDLRKHRNNTMRSG
jgi:hypothetical protein